MQLKHQSDTFYLFNRKRLKKDNSECWWEHKEINMLYQLSGKWKHTHVHLYMCTYTQIHINVYICTYRHINDIHTYIWTNSTSRNYTIKLNTQKSMHMKINLRIPHNSITLQKPKGTRQGQLLINIETVIKWNTISQ